jgi:GTPase SAR1 family protein
LSDIYLVFPFVNCFPDRMKPLIALNPNFYKALSTTHLRTEKAMDAYSNLRDEILHLNRDVSMLFSKAKSIPGMADYSFGEWEKACEHLPRQLAEDIIRVAIVGPIKSGKSTFLNSLFKGEYVKRGAGVITSIVTRVRNGGRLRAKLFFKSWDEINAEMEQALVLFPSANWRSEDSPFDIRKEKQRHALKQALGELSADQFITRSTRNINTVLLSSYLKGYDTVSPLLNSGNAIQLYEDDRFSDHKAFVGNESLAVYLKDVLLEINSDSVKSNIEIADCQGSDSSNPLHLAMIQDYLLLTHLMIYVISSRTGLRRADIRFLSMIKKMGILDNIVFIVNCDFSEHDGIDDLNTLVDRVREELSMLKTDPDIYSFSALYNLFDANRESISDKDRLRMDQWNVDQAFAELSNRETRRFETTFSDSLTRKRTALLLQNHIERMGVVLTGFGEWISLNQEVLVKDTDHVAGILKKIKAHQKRLDQTKTTIKKSLSGAMPEIKNVLQQEVNRFFDAHAGSVIQNIGHFIRGYTLVPGKYQESLKNSDFSQTLYMVFQDFKQSIDSHITQAINPELIRFIQENEKRIGEYFDSLMLPFDAMVDEAYAEFNWRPGRNPAASDAVKRSLNKPPDLDVILNESGLRPPALVTATHYSTGIKAEAIVRFGYYKAVQNVKTVLRKTAVPRDDVKLRVLEDAVRRMKRETEKSAVFHLKDYRENLKFGYLFRLVEAVSDRYAEAVLDRFQMYFSDLAASVERIGSSQSDKEKTRQILNEMDRTIRDLSEKINRIRGEVEAAG